MHQVDATRGFALSCCHAQEENLSGDMWSIEQALHSRGRSYYHSVVHDSEGSTHVDGLVNHSQVSEKALTPVYEHFSRG